jgi:hypothetical protein
MLLVAMRDSGDGCGVIAGADREYDNVVEVARQV